VVAQDGSTEFGVTRSIWLMLELSNVLVSNTPSGQACLVSCNISAEIVTRTTLRQDTTVDKVVCILHVGPRTTLLSRPLGSGSIARPACIHGQAQVIGWPTTAGTGWGIRPEMCAS
jgi:hypothetical protein